MENNNTNTSSGHDTDSNGGVFDGKDLHNPPQDLNALSLDPESLQAVQVSHPQPSPFRRFLKRLYIILFLSLLVGSGILVAFSVINRESTPSNASEANRYGAITLPLEELTAGKNLELPGIATITINGHMQLNNGLRFAPSTQPSAALPGQLYYDQDVNQLAYFNGTNFVFLDANGSIAPGAGVQGLGGLTGQIDIGTGLTAAEGRVSNSGVLSLMGLTGDLTLEAGRGIGIDGMTISSTGIASVASGSPGTLSVATDADGNVVITSTGSGGGGNVSAVGGTAGRFAKFTGTDTIADSLLSESGSVVSLTGDLSVSGSLSLGAPLAVTSGGTGAIVLPANGVLIGQGTGAITSVTSGGAGLCLMSTVGAPTFSACPGGASAVDSLNGLTGALNIANASASGSTVTINDAAVGTKGIASFNGTNFSVSGGDVNTIQNINSGATPTFAGVNTNSITPSAALTLGSITHTALLQGSITTITSSGGGNDITLDSADTIELLDNTNITGALDVSGTLTAGTANAFQVGSGGAITSASTATFQGGFATIGTSSQAGVLVLNDGSSNTGTFQLAALGQNTVYTLPDPGQATASICLTTGNCAGVGGGVTTAGGTTNQLAKFSGSQAIVDSIISDNGTVVTIAGALSVNTLTPTGALTLGATSQNAVLQGAVTTVTATNAGITNTLGFATPSGSAKTVTVPNASGTIAVSASGPLALDANGNITCPTCVTSGGSNGGASAVDSLNGLTGTLSIANATGTGATITIDDATVTTKGIASFNSTNFTVTGGAVNTIQNITTGSTPTFAGINTNSITPSAALTVGATGQTAVVRGSVVTIQSNGAGNDVIIDSADTIELQDNTNITGALDVSNGLNIGTGNALQITAGGDLTSVGSAAYQGGVITLGTVAQIGSIILNDGSSNTGTFQVAALGQNVVYTLPDPGQSTATICLTTGNCTGSAGGVSTPGGTAGVYAKFTGTQTIGDALLSELGSVVTVAGALNLTSGNQYQINGTQISSAALSNDSDLAKLSASQVFAANNTFSGDVVANGNTTLGNSASDTLTIAALLQGATPIVFEGGTVDSNQLSLAVASLTTDRTITLPDESGTLCIQNSTNCGFALTNGSGNGNYIQNQNASDQPADFRISGSGQASSFLTALVDAATASVLSIGTTNATAINLNQNTVVAAGKSLALTGGNTASRPGSPTEGMLYYDTTTKQLLIYANGKWQADRSDSTKIVAMGAATGCTGTVPVASANPDGADFVSTSCTASQTAINAAIAALPASGGTVYLMEGTYVVNGTINVPSNVTLMGAGSATTITIPNSTNASLTIISNSDTTNGNNRLVIRDLRIDGNASNQASGGYAGVSLTKTGSGTGASAVPGATVSNVRIENLYDGSGGHGIYLLNSNNNLIQNNYILKLGSTYNTAIDSSGTSAFNTITANTIQANANGIKLGDSGFNIITNNKIDGAGFYSLYSISGDDTVISGNFMTGGSQGMLLLGGDRLSITGNTVRSTVSYGIHVSGSSNVRLDGNSLYNNAGGGSNSSITVESTGNAITNNTIIDTSGTGYAIAMTATALRTYVSGNTFSGTGATDINDAGVSTTYANQLNGSGDLILRGTNGTAIGMTSATSSLSVQGSYVGTALPSPAAPTLSTQGTAGSTSYTYAVTAYDGFGETLASTGTTIATGNATLTGSNYNRINWVRVGGAVSYKIYRTASAGTPSSTGLIGTVAASTATMQFNDTAIAATGAVPVANTTGGASLAGALQGTTATFGAANALTLGTSSSATGSISFKGAGGTGSITLVGQANPTGAVTITLPDETGTVCLQSSANCGFVTGSASGFIQNQNASQQVSSDFWISGTARADTSTLTPLLDTATAVDLNIGTTNATAINLNENTVIAAGKSITVAGGNTASRPGSPTEGMIYYDTTTKALLTYANGKWQADRSSDTKIVAMGTATGCSGSVPVASSNPDAADFVNTSCTSAQTVINSAISALPASGGTIYLMEGTYIVDGSIILPSNVTFAGASGGTILKMKNNTTSMNMVTNSNQASGNASITIRDMKFDGNKSNNVSVLHTGIYFVKVSANATTKGAVVSNVSVDNFYYEGITLVSSNNVLLDRISCLSTQIHCISTVSANYLSVTNSILSSSGMGIYLLGGTDITLTGNVLKSNTNAGMYITTSVTNLNITGNVISSSATAIYLATNVSNATISGNTLSANAYVDGAIEIDTSSRINITGNSISGSTGPAISLDDTSNTVVSANSLYNNGGSGSESSIRLTTTGAVYAGNSITNNLITDTAGTGYAVSIAATLSQTYLSNNTFSGTGATSINDLGLETIYANQLNGNGDLITRSKGGVAIGTTTATASVSVQGSYVSSTLPTPAAPTLTTSGTAGATSRSYAVTAYDGFGETLASTATVIATTNATLTGTNRVNIAWARIPGAISYKIYRTASAGTPSTTGLIGTAAASLTTLTFSDTGIAATGAVPVANTTGGMSLAGALQGTTATFGSAGALTLGTSSSATGSISFKGSGGTGSITLIGQANPTGAVTITLPDETGTVCLRNSANCGFVTGSASGYIQNQNASQQTASNFWISGSARADTSTITPLIDTATAVDLNIGTTNATAINLNENTVVAAGKSITVAGGNTASRPASPTEGMVYYDTDTKALITYANGKWQADRSPANKIVAMGTTTGCTGSIPTASANPDGADFVSTSCTSAQTAINAAIAALPAGGGLIYLMEGTYIIDGGIALPSNVTLAGSGSSTTIRQKNSTASVSAGLISNSDPTNGNTFIILRDFRLDGNRANQSSGNTCINFTKVGVSAAIKGAAINNIYVENCTSGVNINSSYNVLVDHITVVNAVLSSIAFTSSLNTSLTNSAVINAGSSSIVISAGSSHTIAGNNVSGTSGDGINVGSGSSNDSITGNTIANVTGCGVTLSSTSAATVTGNGITGSGGSVSFHGICNSSSNNTIISSNTLSNNAGSGSTSTISVSGTSTGVSITNNNITDTAGTGYAITISSTTVTKTYLSNNTFSGTGATTINDVASDTIYANQVNGNGDLILRGNNGTAIGTTIATSTLSVQGAYISSVLPAPAAPTLTTSGTAGSTSYTYAVTALDGLGETLASTTTTIATGNATLTGSNRINVAFIRVPGAVSYKIYRTASAGTPSSTGFVGTVAASISTLTFSDTGIAATGAVPVANTTGGMSLAGALQGTTGTFSTAIVAPLLDTATATTLAIGTTNATAITLNKNTTVATGKTLTVLGDSTFQSSVNSATAFRILNAGGLDRVIVDTSLNIFELNDIDFYSNSNSTAALDISNASGDSLLVADTTNGEVNIGSGYQGALLILSNRSTAGDPTGANGGMYYSSSMGDFRCYRDGYWASCSAPTIDRTFMVQDEFLGGNTSGAQIGELGWKSLAYGSGTSVVVFNTGALAPTASHPGILRLKPNDTGGASNSVMALALNSNAGTADSMILAAGSTMRATAAVGSAASTTQTFRIGLFDQSDLRNTNASGVWWEADPTSNANWRYCYVNGAAATVCAASGTAIAANTFARLAIKINALGSGSSSVTFTINGTDTTVSSVTVDAGTLVNNTIGCLAQTSASRDCYVDYYQFTGVVTSPR